MVTATTSFLDSKFKRKHIDAFHHNLEINQFLLDRKALRFHQFYTKQQVSKNADLQR